jgi:hypothetical protein
MRIMSLVGWLWVLSLTMAVGAAHAAGPDTAPTIQTEDVQRFYRLYDAAGGHPRAEQLQHDYIEAGSAGLRHFAKARNVTGSRIVAALAEHPGLYSGARACTAVLPQVRERVAKSLHRLRDLYPQAHLPPVTILVGRGRPVAIGSPDGGLQIGLEALCATGWLNPDLEARFVHVIAHEYVHVQQAPALADDDNPTVLERSLVEGAAEFIAEQISGDVAYSQLRAVTRGREQEIEAAFVNDEDKTDLSGWLDNSTLEKPGDLGYWVGYRIVKAYYQQASDKHQAIADIVGMTSPKAFLARSGWHPGMAFEER